ncbi:hypothetical protein DFH09DRAFT_1323425 [Mycena vulgaris]|nr:hypothetical protein DFH09DRAFT_1323425 [Mycena vulgaris]
MGKRKRNVEAPDNCPSGEYINEVQESQDSKAKKAKSHRKASAAYDQSRGDEGEKLAQSSGQTERRQWDPPKALRVRTPSLIATEEPEASVNVPVEEGALWELRTENIWILEAQLEPRIRELEALHNTGARLNLVLEMCVELTASLNSDEHLALAALAVMAGGAVGNAPEPEADVEVDSILEMVRFLSSHRTEAGEGPCIGQAASVPAMVAPIEQSPRVHQAQIAVAALSARPFPALEVLQVMKWEDVFPRERPPRLLMTFATYWRVVRWSKKTAKRGNNDWDRATADAMVELAESVPMDRMLEQVWERIIGLSQ